MDGSFDPRPQYQGQPGQSANPLLPTPKQQSWGTVISIIIIVMMIVVGALYTWGQRIAAERSLVEQASSTASQ